MIQKLWFPEKRDWYIETIRDDEQDDYYKFKRIHDHIAEQVGGYIGWKMLKFTLELVDKGLYAPIIKTEEGGGVSYGVLVWSFTHGTHIPIGKMLPMEKDFAKSMIDYYTSTN